jgi:hypothetical protein
VPVEPAAVHASQERPVGAFTDGGVDGASSWWCKGDEGGLVALADDPDDAVAVGQRQIGEVRAARFRHAQRVEGE